MPVGSSKDVQQVMTKYFTNPDKSVLLGNVWGSLLFGRCPNNPVTSILRAFLVLLQFTSLSGHDCPHREHGHPSNVQIWCSVQKTIQSCARDDYCMLQMNCFRVDDVCFAASDKRKLGLTSAEHSTGHVVTQKNRYID